MDWICGTGRCGTLSLARQVGGEHEPSPGIGPNCDVKAVLRTRLARGVPSSDRLHSLVIPQIYEIDPEAKILWLLRDPFSCVRSMLQTGHLDVEDSPYFPLPSDTLTEPAQRAAWVWCHINSQIWDSVQGRNYELIPTENLHRHEGASRKIVDLSEYRHLQVEKVAGDLWRALWNAFPILQKAA